MEKSYMVKCYRRQIEMLIWEGVKTMKGEAEVKVKSLQKALEILGCFVEKQPLGTTEISEKLGLYKSNVHNILMTFTAMGYLEQDTETGKFRLGTVIFALSRALRFCQTSLPGILTERFSWGYPPGTRASFKK